MFKPVSHLKVTERPLLCDTPGRQSPPPPTDSEPTPPPPLCTALGDLSSPPPPTTASHQPPTPPCDILGGLYAPPPTLETVEGERVLTLIQTGCSTDTGTGTERLGPEYYLARGCSTVSTLPILSQTHSLATAAHLSTDSDTLADCKHSMLEPNNSATFRTNQDMPGKFNLTFNLVSNHQLVATPEDEMTARSEISNPL